MRCRYDDGAADLCISNPAVMTASIEKKERKICASAFDFMVVSLRRHFPPRLVSSRFGLTGPVFSPKSG